MIRRRLSRAFTLAAAAAAVILGAGPALAASGWTIVSAPPIGQNAVLEGVTAPSDGNAWAVGYSNAAANGLGAKRSSITGTAAPGHR